LDFGKSAGDPIVSARVNLPPQAATPPATATSRERSPCGRRVIVALFSCTGTAGAPLRTPKIRATCESSSFMLFKWSPGATGGGPADGNAPRLFPMVAVLATNHTPAVSLDGTRPPAFEAWSTSDDSGMRLSIHDIARSLERPG
jgi:hypothetical protein